VINNLNEGDILYLDFDALVLKVIDVSSLNDGFIICNVIVGGKLGNNKGVVIDSRFPNKIVLPTLTDKDKKAIDIGLYHGIEHIALSFVRSKDSVKEVKDITNGKMKIISKIECLDGLLKIDEIIECSDYLLMDRGDLSKEITIKKIPFVQKIILQKARPYNKEVFIATNLLESMISNRQPTRAEVNDIVNIILDGAKGLVLAAETAIGQNPMLSINMLMSLIDHVERNVEMDSINKQKHNIQYVEELIESEYLIDYAPAVTILPHGNKLIDRCSVDKKANNRTFQILQVDEIKRMEIENIATGVYSPLKGFMSEDDLNSVLKTMKLSNGITWPLPIVLDVSKDEASKVNCGETIGLSDVQGNVFALMDLNEKYEYSRTVISQVLYNSVDPNHPGVRQVNNMKPVFLAGNIELISSKNSLFDKFKLTPKQVRKLFNEMGWYHIAGFHTRNLPHKGHEYILKSVLKNGICDGLLIHPVIGKKKAGDFLTKHIMNSYDILIKDKFFKNNVILSGFSSFSRYAGSREAIFTALIRKNYGCTHFIIGRDHTGIGNINNISASNNLLDEVDDLGIKIIKMDEVFYSEKEDNYFYESQFNNVNQDSKTSISGTKVREYFSNNEKPPEWLLSKNISEYILSCINNHEELFV
jgi:ATP sulfurylase